jgi:hypothetical protein
LTDTYQTDWALIAGIDRADPLKENKLAGARTIITVVAKGLPNSKGNPEAYIEDGEIKKYIYFLVHLAHIGSNELNDVKYVLKRVVDDLDGLETVCSERWGMWDMSDWCELNDIVLETVSPTYEKQRLMFSELFNLYKTGLIKTPRIHVPGAKTDDILTEELQEFDHNPHKKWYGSPQKGEKYGVQDDAVYALAHAIYGGRNLGPLDFRSREAELNFGMMFNESTVGVY